MCLVTVVCVTVYCVQVYGKPGILSLIAVPYVYAVQCSLTRAEQEFTGQQSTVLAAPVRNLSLKYFKNNHRQVTDL